jgi:uncharacterized protein (DUF58 family)
VVARLVPATEGSASVTTLKLSPQLLQRLGRARLRPRFAGTAGGIGERLSGTRGAGMEFADHRPYQPGDDLRHLDPHLEARLGEAFIRQYSVYEQLRITVLLDMSASMAQGTPGKSVFARQLAAALAFTGLAGNDQVRVAAFSGRGIAWSPRVHSARDFQTLFAWLGQLVPAGEAAFAPVVRQLAPQLPREGALIIISDWLLPELEQGFGPLLASGQELVAVQVCSPEELDPTLLGTGAVTLQDSETGAEFHVALDAAALRQYAQNLEKWQADLKSQFVRRGGSWLPTRSDARLEDVLLRDWARLGFIS